MSYAENSLFKDETIVSSAQFSWLSLISTVIIAAILSAIGIAMIVITRFDWVFLIISSIFYLIAAVMIIERILSVLLQELTLTNKRLIGKVGILSRKTLDAPLNKLNNISVQQGILARIFKYGTVSVTTSSGEFKFDFIQHPTIIKNLIIEQIDIADQQRVMEQAQRIAETIK